MDILKKILKEIKDFIELYSRELTHILGFSIAVLLVLIISFVRATGTSTSGVANYKVRSNGSKESKDSKGSKGSKDSVSGMDAIIKLEEGDITVRQLFEAANEEIKYANHVNVNGNIQHVISGVPKDNPFSDASNKEDYWDNVCHRIDYDRYYTDADNCVSVMKGNAYCRFKNTLDYVLKQYGYSSEDFYYSASYNYYKGIENGEKKESFSYSGDEFITLKVDVERLLLPGLNTLSGMNIESSISDNVITVCITGDGISYFRDAFSYHGGSIDTVYYKFYADSRKLFSVVIVGTSMKDNFMNPESYTSFEADFAVEEVEFGEVETVTIPELPSENMQVNDLFNNGKKFSISDKTEMPFIEETQWGMDAAEILDQIRVSPGEATLGEINSSFNQIAQEKGYESAKCSYVVLKDEKTALLKFDFTKNGQEVGSILIPVTCSDVYECGINLVVGSNGNLNTFDGGSIRIMLRISDTLMGEAVYELDDEGKLTKKYVAVEEVLVSNLVDEDEMNAFSSTDHEELMVLVNDYECASYASIIRVEEYDGEKSTVEYYIEIDDNTQALESLTGLEFMSQRNYSSLREISFEEVITEWILIEE